MCVRHGRLTHPVPHPTRPVGPPGGSCLFRIILSVPVKADRRLTWYRGVPYMTAMTHTIREKKKLLARVGRIRGQVEAIERALNEEAGCDRIMHMIAGVRGGVAGLMAEVVEDHIRTHLVDPEKNPGALNADAADQLIEVVHSYLK